MKRHFSLNLFAALSLLTILSGCSTDQDSTDENVTDAASTAPTVSTGTDLHYSSIGSKYLICVDTSNYASSSDKILGEIRHFEGVSIPKNWFECDGRLLSIDDYPDLHDLVGTSFGGDGRINFGLPDLRGRIPVGAKYGKNVGQKGGQEFLKEEGQKLSIIQPYLTINYIIRTDRLKRSGFDPKDIRSDIGEIKMVAWPDYMINRALPNYTICDGRELMINKYTYLFEAIGKTFGGDGRTTFAVPDLNLRCPIQYTENGQFSSIGEKVGSNTLYTYDDVKEYSNLSSGLVLNFQIQNKSPRYEELIQRFIRLFSTKSLPPNVSEELVKKENFAGRFVVGIGKGKDLQKVEEGEKFGQEKLSL